MRKKKAGKNPNEVLPGWMASYADMFTVLFAFFVLLFALSRIDVELFERFIISFNPSRANDDRLVDLGEGGVFALDGAGIMPEIENPPEPGAEGEEDGTGEEGRGSAGGDELQGDDISHDMMNTFRTYMAEVLTPADFEGEMPGGFEIKEGDNYILLSVDEQGRMFFGSGQATLTLSARESLDIVGPVLKRFADDGHGILVEGHTDDRPIRSAVFPSNWTLSAVRASTVVEYLVDNFDINVSMIAGLGRGEYFPTNTESNPEAWAQNRRVEIKVFNQEATTGGVFGEWFQIPGT